MKATFLKVSAFVVLLATTLVPDAQTVSYLRNNSFTNWESPQVHPLDMTPDGTRLLAVNTANNTLEIYNSSVSNQAPSFVRSVPVGIDPVTVRARTNTEAWVVNVISDSVSIVDLQNGIVTATLQADDEPADVIFAGSSQGSAFVSCAQAKTLLVFNALAPISAAPQRIPINGEQPRALASSANGRFVYLAIFESGNATTILPGGVQNGFEHDVVRDPSGPYGGVNAPPNNGANFSPALNPANPAPIPVSLIVRKILSGGLSKWVDDNGVDWSAFVTGSKARTGTPGDRVAGWDMLDRDVAIIDTGSNNAVTYQSGLMNMVMSIGVNPSTGNVTVIGTDSTNQIRYEPVLQSTFVHVEGASFVPGGANTIFDLNPHITYKVKSVPMAQRQLSIGDPRGIAWNAAGTTAYITGMGSNNVILTGNTGARQGLINVGQGPTGIVLNESNGRAFVLNRFDATISTVNLGTQTQAFVTPLQYDPTPTAIKAGRPILYNTQLNSGLGQVSCGSCHVDARTDRLAWDLGNPAGSVVTNSQGASFHPMKGPLLTMTMVDMMQAPFLHWRGDRQLDDFEGAFQTLQGGDAPATGATMVALQNFLGTITLPPNPYRNLDNSYSTNVPFPGPNNSIILYGNAVTGAQEFEGGCRSCHLGETNRGILFDNDDAAFGVGIRNPPNWKNFYKRMGLWYTDPTASTVGFGTQQDGTFDSTQNQSRDANMYAFMMSFNGGYPYEPAGLAQNNWSNFTHAAVGKQVTLSPENPTDATGLLAQLETLAGQGAIGLVAKGGPVGSPVRGWMYMGNNLWQSDHLAEVDATSTLMTNAAKTAALTFTAVPTEGAVRIGIDMDSDGILDSDDPNPAVPNATVVNMALNGTATAAPPWDANHGAAAAIDGSTMGYFDQNQMYQSNGGTNDWWQVDLGTSAEISLIQLFNRWDCCGTRLSNVSVFVSQAPFASTALAATRAQAGVQEFFLAGAAGLIPQIPMQTQGRYVRVQLNANDYLQLAEVRVMGFAIGSFINPGAQTSAAQTGVNLPITFNNTSGNTYTLTALNLPPGLGINSSNGTISGTPTTAGSYTVTVTAVGAGNPSISFPWTVSAAPQSFILSPQVSTLTLAPGASGSFALSVVAGGGFNSTVSFTMSGLPTGVTGSIASVTPANMTNAVISASASSAGGTYPVTIKGVSGGLSASTSFSLVILSPQTINFAAIANQTVGTVLPLAATASSGLPVIFTSATPNLCTVAASTASFLSAGTCTITVTQAGSSKYAPAASVSQSFALTPALTGTTTNTTICQAQPGYGSYCSDLLPSTTNSGGYNSLPAWTNLGKTLASISVSDNQVWGLDSSGTLWNLPNFKAPTLTWIKVATGVSQISSGHNLLCQLNSNTHVLCSVSPNPQASPVNATGYQTVSWFDAGATNYKQIAVSAGNQVWAVDVNSNLIQISDYTKLSATSIPVAYGYQQVAVDGKGLLCGSATDNNVYCNHWPVPPATTDSSGYYHSITGWIRTGAVLHNIAVADGKVYGVDASANVWLLPDYTNSGTWEKISYGGGVADGIAAASSPSSFTAAAFAPGDVAVLFFMGQSNSAGINAMPSQFIAPASPNVHGVTNGGWNFLPGNVEGTTPFTGAISTIASVGWSNWSVAAAGPDMNLGFNAGAAGNAANFAAYLWQGMINAGMKLPDLYIVHIAWPSEGVDAGDATTASASWLVHGENLWQPGLTNASQPSYALAPFGRRILYQALNSLISAGKTPRILGLQWNQWEADAEAQNANAIPDAPANYNNLFSGFDAAVGTHFPVQIVKPLSTAYGAATGKMQTVFANLVTADPTDYSILDISQSSSTIYSGGVLGGGDGSVHYNLDTHQWFARQAIGTCLTLGNCGPRISAIPSTPTN